MELIHYSDLMNPRGIRNHHRIVLEFNYGYEMSITMNKICAVVRSLKSDDRVVWDSGHHKITLWVESEQTETLLRMNLA